jgi:cytochrome P450
MGGPAIAFVHPDAIKRILITNSKNYVKGAAYDGVRRVIGNGILALEGAEWKKRRSVLNPAFHRSALVGLTATMAESGTEVTRRVGPSCGVTATRRGRPNSPQQIMGD